MQVPETSASFHRTGGPNGYKKGENMLWEIFWSIVAFFSAPSGDSSVDVNVSGSEKATPPKFLGDARIFQEDKAERYQPLVPLLYPY